MIEETAGSGRPAADVAAHVSNAQMAAKILSMPDQPFRDEDYVLRVAEIRGRTSARPIQVPIAVTLVSGHQYLISPDSGRPWARNLTVIGQCDLLARSSRTHYLASAANPTAAIAALRCYLTKLGWAAQQFPFAADDSDERIAEQLSKVAVFRLDPA